MASIPVDEVCSGKTWPLSSSLWTLEKQLSRNKTISAWINKPILLATKQHIFLL